MRYQAPCACLLLVVFCLLPSGSSTRADPPNNPIGVVTALPGSFDTTGASLHLEDARRLVGEWGYIRQGFDLSSPEAVKRAMVLIRAKRLIPVFTAGSVPEAFQEEDRPWPKREEDGGFRQAARAAVEPLRRLYEKGIPPFILEVLNEPNWDPAVYARWLYDFATAAREAYPGLPISSCGIGGAGDEFYDGCLTAVPELKEVVDYWACHPYGANHPPDYDQDSTTLRGYEWTLRALRRHGVENPRLLLTETGYELNDRSDARYPAITESLRAYYLPRAFQDLYLSAPEVEAVCLFMLSDVNYNNWPGWDLVRFDGTFTPAYEALMMLPRPTGSDWLPRGDAAIEGVVCAEGGRPVPYVFVWSEPGYYAAETDLEGRYRIDGVPAGVYRLQAMRDGYYCDQPGQVRLAPGETLRRDLNVRPAGLLTSTMEAPSEWEGLPQPWTPADGHTHPMTYAIDNRIRRSGAGSLRVQAGTDAARQGLWAIGDYLSATPGWVYTLQLWRRAEAVRLGQGRGIRVALEFASSQGQPLYSAELFDPVEGDSGWQPLVITMMAPPETRRLRVSIGVEAEGGTVWFDDLWTHYAHLPLPAELEMLGVPLEGMISGTVRDGSGRPLAGASVYTRPQHQWTITREDGSFLLGGRLAVDTVRAFYPGLSGASAEVRFERGFAEVNLELQRPPRPAQLTNSGFEDYGLERSLVAGWTKWGALDGIVESGKYLFEMESYQGNGFLAAGSGSNTKNGGVFQTISVEPGQPCRVTVWVQTRQVGGEPGDTACRLGVHPAGIEDPLDPAILWSPFTTSEAEWSPISLTVTPLDRYLTVYLQARQLRPNTWNVCAFDEVKVERVDR